MTSVPLSLLGLAAVVEGETVADSFAGSLMLAQLAEHVGYQRVWYAEHHSIARITSPAVGPRGSSLLRHRELSSDRMARTGLPR